MLNFSNYKHIPLPKLDEADHKPLLTASWLGTSFMDYFHKQGFVLKEAEPLVPRTDKSILFTNAFIVACKDLLIASQGLRGQQGLVMYQPCFRAHNLKGDLLDPTPPAYLSYFHMVGGVCAPESLPKLLDNLWHFFSAILSIEPKRLLFKASRKNLFIIEQLYTREGESRVPLPTIVFEESNPSYYQWSYGASPLAGSGLTMALRQADGSYQDFGNIVAISNAACTLGYEFGFGVETLAARLLNLRSPLLCNPIHSCFPELQEPRFDLIKDLIVAAVVMVNAHVPYGYHGRSDILRKTIKKIALAIHLKVLSTRMVFAAVIHTVRYFHFNQTHIFTVESLISKALARLEASSLKDGKQGHSSL